MASREYPPHSLQCYPVPKIPATFLCTDMSGQTGVFKWKKWPRGGLKTTPFVTNNPGLYLLFLRTDHHFRLPLFYYIFALHGTCRSIFGHTQKNSSYRLYLLWVDNCPPNRQQHPLLYLEMQNEDESLRGRNKTRKLFLRKTFDPNLCKPPQDTTKLITFHKLYIQVWWDANMPENKICLN